MRTTVLLILVAVLGVFAVGCSGPIKRKATNVFPGTDDYEKRVKEFKITPAQAYRIAHKQAEEDDQLQYMSRKPTLIHKRSYVFSLPLPSGGNLQGYHVDGDTGEVSFERDKKIVPHSKR